MEKRNVFKMNVGGSSIILIIVVFALSIFGALSIKASNSDLKLAKKTREAMMRYYHADNKAEVYLAQIDEVLHVGKTGASLEGELTKLESGPDVNVQSSKTGTLTYTVAIDDHATLNVAIAYNLESKDSLYNVITWKVNQDPIGEYNFTNFEFWDGQIEED